MENDSAMTEFASLMRGRAAFYNFFSTIFKEPLASDNLNFVISSAEYFAMLAEESALTELEKGSELFEIFAKTAAEHIGKDEAKVLAELNMVYSSLFYLGSHSVRYTESSFLSKAGLWKQEEWEQVKEIYRLNRFAIPEGFQEPEDHVAMELLFMSAISELMARSIENNDSENYTKYIAVQNSFLHEHLAKWVPDFCNSILAKAAGIDAYHAYESSAMLLKGYLQYDRVILAELVSPQTGSIV